jgi:hypothetical protein
MLLKMYPPGLHYQVNKNAPINRSSLVNSIRSKALYFIEIEHTVCATGVHAHMVGIPLRTTGNCCSFLRLCVHGVVILCGFWPHQKTVSCCGFGAQKSTHTHTLSLSLPSRTHTIHCKENSYYIFPEIKLRGLVPNVCERFILYILRIYPPILLQPNWQTNHGNICINRPQIYECRNWD